MTLRLTGEIHRVSRSPSSDDGRSELHSRICERWFHFDKNPPWDEIRESWVAAQVSRPIHGNSPTTDPDPC